MSGLHQQRLEETRHYWNDQAETFDNEIDHGLRDPLTYDAWKTLLQEKLPPPPASILDVGCGTGSLSLLLARLNYQVTGIDLSEAMLAQARKKVERDGYSVAFKLMDAFEPNLPGQKFNVIVCRHVLWALPDIAVALERWAALLSPQGRLLLIEGFWDGGGLHAQQVVDALPSPLTNASVEMLSSHAALWGAKMKDERYIITARLLNG